jgi:hypothetical protein
MVEKALVPRDDSIETTKVSIADSRVTVLDPDSGVQTDGDEVHQGRAAKVDKGSTVQASREDERYGNSKPGLRQRRGSYKRVRPT